MRQVLYSQKGFNYVTLVLVLLLAGVIFCGATIAPKYITNYRLKQEAHKVLVQCTSMVKDERITIDKANTILKNFINEKKMPIDAEKITLCHLKNRDAIECKFEYSWPVEVFGQQLFSLKFRFEDSKKLNETSY